MRALTVTHHFADYKPGDQITDAKLMQVVTESENASKVVAVELPDAEPEAPEVAEPSSPSFRRE